LLENYRSSQTGFQDSPVEIGGKRRSVGFEKPGAGPARRINGDPDPPPASGAAALVSRPGPIQIDSVIDVAAMKPDA